MKKLMYIISIILCFGALVVTNNKINKLENQIDNMNNNNNKSVVKALEVSAVEGVEKEFKIVNTYINKSNNNIIEFNDNSYLVINHNKNIYEFYATECGDYGIKAQDTKELTNIIKTYMLNKYNMNESELDKDNIFKNDILNYEPQAKDQNTIAETQENKKVVKSVKKEINNTIKNESIKEIEETTEQTNTIEEPTTAIEEQEENKEQIQSNYTKEDYNKYSEYKENLIKEYGEEIYKLMNQEAGITTEEESFKHFMEYGI